MTKETHLFIKIKEGNRIIWLHREMPYYESSISGWVQNACADMKRAGVYIKHKLVNLD